MTGKFRRTAIFLLGLFLCVIYSDAFGAVDPADPAAAREIPLLTYHTHPPFITGEASGLSYDLAAYLNNKAAGRYHFSVRPMSRPALNNILEEGRRGIVPWVNPAWFQQIEQSKITWTSGSLMQDGNAVLSRQDRKLVYAGPQSLDNMLLGGLKGHHYAGIDEYISETGRIRRIDTDNHLDNFRKLVMKRIDVTLMPISGARYLLREQGLLDDIYISPELHSAYARKALLIDPPPGLLPFLEQILAELATDPDWLGLLRKYE